jgi:hypothetical protein
MKTLFHNHSCVTIYCETVFEGFETTNCMVDFDIVCIQTFDVDVFNQLMPVLENW